MTPLLFIVGLTAEIFMVAGQLLLKRAMLLTNHRPLARRRFGILFSLAIASMTGYFILWLGLMRDLPLSQQYPFEVLSLVMLVLAATLFLREKLSARAWAGIALICAGLGLVCLSG